MKYERRGNELPLQNLLFMHHHNHYSYRRFMPFLFSFTLVSKHLFFADADAVVYHTVYGSLRYHNFVNINIVKPSWGPPDGRLFLLSCFVLGIRQILFFLWEEEICSITKSMKWHTIKVVSWRAINTFSFISWDRILFMILCEFCLLLLKRFSFDLLNEDWRRLQNVNLSFESVFFTKYINAKFMLRKVVPDVLWTDKTSK